MCVCVSEPLSCLSVCVCLCVCVCQRTTELCLCVCLCVCTFLTSRSRSLSAACSLCCMRSSSSFCLRWRSCSLRRLYDDTAYSRNSSCKRQHFMCVCARIYTYISISIYTHTHTNTHTPIKRCCEHLLNSS